MREDHPHDGHHDDQDIQDDDIGQVVADLRVGESGGQRKYSEDHGDEDDRLVTTVGPQDEEPQRQHEEDQRQLGHAYR